MGDIAEEIKSDHFFDIAANEYKKFRGTAVWDEQYKWDILPGLHTKFIDGNFTKDSILKKISLLEEYNPSSGSFVYWSEINNLKRAAQENPALVAEQFNLLQNGSIPLQERIEKARDTLKEITYGNFGTAFFAFILAAFNPRKYPLYRKELFTHFQALSDLEFNYSRSDIGEKYVAYILVCNEISEFLDDYGVVNNPDVMDAQDFLYCISGYDELKYKIYVKCLFDFAQRLKNFEENPSEFVDAISQMDRDHLADMEKKYRDSEKINDIKHKIIKKILADEPISIEYVHKVMGQKSTTYGEAFLKSWNEFRILFQIYFIYFKPKISYLLTTLHAYLRQYKPFGDTRFDEKNTINDFSWNRNFGISSCWIALYPAGYDSHQDAAQLFLGVYHDKIMYGLAIGENIRSKVLDHDFETVPNAESFSLNQVLQKLQSVYPTFKEINNVDTTRYWKISPGKNAWNWDTCREGEFIAIGWDKTGDISQMNREEFENRRDKLVAENEDYTTEGMEQLWKFVNEIKIGDYIVANRGITEVLGLGKITEHYYFEPNEKHGHRYPVEWTDTTPKQVDEPGWRRTLLELDKQKFESITQKKLAEPFDAIFRNKHDADLAFNLLEKAFDVIGITTQDECSSVTITRSGNTLRLNYGNWAVIHFSYKGKNDYRIGMALQGDIDPDLILKQWDYFADSNVRLTELPFDVLPLNKDLLNTFKQTLTIIAERFADWDASPYRKYNQPEIVKSILDESKRSKLLEEGVEDLAPYIPEDEDLQPNYFWITANPAIWSVDSIKDGGAIFYSAVNEKGNRRRIYEAFQKARKGDKVIFYEASPVKEIVATGAIKEGLHIEPGKPAPDREVEGITIGYDNKVAGISWQQLTEVADLQDAAPIANRAQGSLFELSPKEYETILSLETPPDVPEYHSYSTVLKVNFNRNEHQLIEQSNLYFEEADNLFSQILTALKNGKHIILNGPPGTGKSKLAKEICKVFCGDNHYRMVTASSDWSTFDTIGGYMPCENQQLEFKPGVFLECFQTEKGKPANKWLILDEINRADIDKAFGALFSALTGDNVRLAQELDGNRIKVLGNPKEDDKIHPYRFFIHPDWRIIATMNTFDKASLYEMSYAFMRRFAFINVGVPKNIEEALPHLTAKWGITDLPESVKNDIVKLWTTINKYRKIGPAIARDMLNHIQQGGGYVSAISMYVFPQFEGIPQDEQINFIKELKSNGLTDDEGYARLKEMAIDFFEIPTEKFKHD